MTITFENDDDVVIYALEKSIAYARRTQQIFMAQCVWWLASILGLEQGLLVYIDNLQRAFSEASVETSGQRVSVTPRDIQEDSRLCAELSPALPKDLRINSNQREKTFSPTPQFVQEDLRPYTGNDNIHLDRIQQIGKETPDLEEEFDNIHLDRIQQIGKETPDLEKEFDSEPDQPSRVLKKAEQFLSISKRDRKAFSKKKAKDQLSRTRSGKIIAKPLSNKQRNYLQSIPKDTIVEYIANRK